jgi:hypothetical protein
MSLFEYLPFLLLYWRLLLVMLSFLNIRVGLGALCFLVPSGSTNVASSISFLAWNLGLAPLISSLLRSRLEISPSIAIAILLCKVLSRIGLQLNQNWPEINKSWPPWSWNKPKNNPLEQNNREQSKSAAFLKLRNLAELEVAPKIKIESLAQ